MSECTLRKKAIALAFKNVMSRKPLEKITVQDITQECGINRQTFYYHFEDRNDLMNWIFYNEVFLPCVEVLTDDNCYDTFLLMLQIIANENTFYKNAFSIASSNKFLYNLYAILETLVETISKKKKATIDVCFYAHGLLGIITYWVENGMPYSTESLALELTNILNNAKTNN